MRPVSFDPFNHSYFTDEGIYLPSVTRILMDEGFINDTWFTEASRERGTAVHDAVKMHHMAGGCAPADPEHEGYFEAYLRFTKECDWVPEFIEVPVGCDLYAGMPDQVGKMREQPGILDLKSGKVSPITGLQLQGYSDIYNIPGTGRYGLYLKDNGRYNLVTYDSRQDKYIWRSAVALWHYKKNLGIRKERR